ANAHALPRSPTKVKPISLLIEKVKLISLLPRKVKLISLSRAGTKSGAAASKKRSCTRAGERGRDRRSAAAVAGAGAAQARGAAGAAVAAGAARTGFAARGRAHLRRRPRRSHRRVPAPLGAVQGARDLLRRRPLRGRAARGDRRRGARRPRDSGARL